MSVARQMEHARHYSAISGNVSTDVARQSYGAPVAGEKSREGLQPTGSASKWQHAHYVQCFAKSHVCVAPQTRPGKRALKLLFVYV